MRFESLSYDHLPQIAAIEAATFASPWTENMFKPDVEDANAYYVVGVEAEEVVCYGGFHKVLDEAQMANIAVKEKYRGKGLGKMLVKKLLELAKSIGVKSVTLEVRADNAVGIRLYESFGFRTEGVRRKYYENEHDALIMWLNL